MATLFGLISSLIIARFYGAEVLGIIAILNSFLLLATIFTVLGTNTSILRLIPEHIVKYSYTSAFRVYRKVQFMAFGISLITGILFFFAADLVAGKIFSKPHLSFYFGLASAFIVFKSLMLLNTQAVRSIKLIKVFAFMQFMPQVTNLALLLILGTFSKYKGIPVYALLGSFAITGIVGWITMEVAFKNKMNPQDHVKPMNGREILSISLPMLITASMQFLISQTAIIVLGMFRNEAEIGYFSIALKLATLTIFFLQAMNSMAAPKFSELFHSDQIDELFYVAKKSAKLIFYITSPILLGIILLGKPILSILFGNDFIVAYPALVLIVIGQFVNSASGSTGIFMNMTGNQAIFRNIIMVAAVINIVLNIFLIPEIGITGAAIATMISIIFWNISSLFYIRLKFSNTIGYIPLFSK